MWTTWSASSAAAVSRVGTRGPGEQQLEIDRRLAQDKRLALQAPARRDPVRKQREVRERKIDYFTVGLSATPTPASPRSSNAHRRRAYATTVSSRTSYSRTRTWDLKAGGGAGSPSCSRTPSASSATSPPTSRQLPRHAEGDARRPAPDPPRHRRPRPRHSSSDTVNRTL